MKLTRVLLALAALTCLAGVAYVSQQQPDTAGRKITTAAQTLLDGLDAAQKAKAQLPFDGKERISWNFVPLQDKKKQSTRKGLALKDMNEAQKKAALALVAAGTSESGYVQATTIMSLESILNEVEKGGANVRNPEWYFFTVFGEPSKTGKWGWRVEGHHLSLNYTLGGSEVVSATPFFFGANPAEIKQGPRKGHRPLPDAEDSAKQLIAALDADQKKVALRPKSFPEPKANQAEAGVGEPAGLPVAKMNDKQRDLLMKLVESHAGRKPADVAKVELERLRKAGVEKIHFAYSGSTEPGKGYTYRVQGPNFVVEFLNIQADSQNIPANHIHNPWRTLPRDFGLDAK